MNPFNIFFSIDVVMSFEQFLQTKGNFKSYVRSLELKIVPRLSVGPVTQSFFSFDS
jgi:hypothetical protein